MFDFLDVELSQRRMLVFFLLAVFVFVFPLILADNYYIDDNWRAQTAGMSWKEEGRILVGWLYQGLSFTRGAPNIFPLPLLISSVVMAFALRSLTHHYFLKPTIVSCLVVLPLWYSPFFLQNLSYQYDGPATTLGVSAVIYAITFRHPSRIARAVVPGLCIAVGLSFYQVLLDLYLGLCCIELIRMAHECKDSRLRFTAWGGRLLHLLLGVTFYWLTAYQFITNVRTALRELNNGWLEKLVSDLHLAAQRVALLYNEGNAWLCWALLIMACAGFGRIIYWILRGRASRSHRVLLVSVCVLAVILAFILIPGMALIFNFYNDGARLMVGASSALVLIFYFNHQVLTAIHPRVAGLLIIPIIAMLSFSYAYGRVMNLQKDLFNSIAQHVAYDVLSNNDLGGVERYHMIIGDTKGWLAGADGAFKLMPALKYVLNVDFLMLAEAFPRSSGVTNVAYLNNKSVEKIMAGISAKGRPLRDNKFYSIYVDGVDGYIVMKAPSADDVFVLH